MIDLFIQVTVFDIIDILLVAGLFYGLYRLLKGTSAMSIFIGISRKSLIFKVLGTTPQAAENGTTVLNTIALLNGADILRVHDVKNAKEAVDLVEKYRQSIGKTL